MNAASKSPAWLAAGIALILVISLLWPGNPETAQAPASKESSARKKLSSGSKDDAKQQTGSPASAGLTVKLPMAMVELLNLEVFNEGSGALTNEFGAAFRLTPEERKSLRNIIAGHLRKFQELELANLESERKGMTTTIRLKPCATHAKALEEETRAALAPLIGASRAEAPLILLSRQLRNGGEDAMELTMGPSLNSSGTSTLELKHLGAHSTKPTYMSHQGLQRPDFSQFVRWEHLDRATPDEGE